MKYDGKISIKGLKFSMTSEFCPEQYDVYFMDKPIGYVRLRGGYFTVSDFNITKDYYEYWFNDKYKGCFDNDVERDKYLNIAADAIIENMKEEV